MKQTLQNIEYPYIIADVGSNWKRYQTDTYTDSNWAKNKRLAIDHIRDAAWCGVSAVKFQLFTDSDLYGMAGPNQYALPTTWLMELAAEATECGIDFLCTAFDPAKVPFVDAVVNIHKIASSEMKYPQLIDAIAKTGKPILISTGAAHYTEIEWVEKFLHDRNFPLNQVCFMECVGAYPAPDKDYNLDWNQRAVRGLSDHTLGTDTATRAAVLGFEIYEKHFDCLKHLNAPPTPDTGVSASAAELIEYVKTVRKFYRSKEQAPPKCARGSENDMVTRYRRRLKIIKTVPRGTQLKYGVNYGIYRSITEDTSADAPEKWERYEGKCVKRDLYPGEGIWKSDVVL